MAGWLDTTAEEATQATGQPAAKRQAVVNREAKEAEMNALILSLQTAQTARQLSGCAWWTVMIPAELGANALATTEKHAEQTRGVTNHKMGSPHIQLWRTLLKTLIDSTSGSAELKEDVQTVMKYLSEMEAKGPNMGHYFISQARLKVVKDPQFMILFYSLSDMIEPGARYMTDVAMHKLLASMKAEVKPGTAPPSEAETKVQAQVDKLRAELGLNNRR
jgi:hypothetical protein